MNTHELFQHHLRVAEQNNRCTEVLRAINQRKESIQYIEQWLETPELDWKVPQSYIDNEKTRMNRYRSKVIPKLLKKYQNELRKLDQIYKA